MRMMMRGLVLLTLVGGVACSPSDEAENTDPPSAAPDVGGGTTPAPLPPVVGDDTTAAMDTTGNAGVPLPSPGTADSMSAATPG